jgi:hypothetical protein
MSRAVWELPGLFQIKLGSVASDAPTEGPGNLSHAQAHQPRVSGLLRLPARFRRMVPVTNTLSNNADQRSPASATVRELR